MKTWMKLTAGMLAIVLASIAIFGGAMQANAQTATPQAPDSAQTRAALRVAQVLISETAKATGLTQAEILQQITDGKTLNDIITANNGDPAAVQDAAKTQLTTDINQAVSDGRLKQAQADKMLAALDTVLSGAMDGQYRDAMQKLIDQLKNRALARIAANAIAFQQTAKATGLSQRDLLKEIRSDKTLAQVATDHQVDPATIVSACVTVATNRINRLVQNGRLTRPEADKLIAALPDAFTKVMNNPFKLTGRSRVQTPDSTPQPTPAATPSL